MAGDKDRFVLPTQHFTIEGRSRAGHETWFRIRELGIGLDIGRCPDEMLGLDHIFVTHLHLDHGVGIPFYAGQRHLHKLSGGTVYVPAEAEGDLREILGVYERMTGSRFDVTIRGMAVGEELAVSRSLVVRAHAAPHRVPARGFEFLERRHRLLPELAGTSGEELARLRGEGVAVDQETRRPILFYTGDCDRGVLEQGDAIFRAEVLMIECSFAAEDDQDRAAKYQHIHIDDIAEFAPRFENALIVLTHFSQRYSRERIRDMVRARVPASLRDRIRLALPESHQRL